MDKKNCLTCKWQPKWGDVYGGKEFPRRSGECRHPLASANRIAQHVPGCVVVTPRFPVNYIGSDEVENVRMPCPRWEDA